MFDSEFEHRFFTIINDPKERPNGVWTKAQIRRMWDRARGVEGSNTVRVDLGKAVLIFENGKFLTAELKPSEEPTETTGS